LLRVVPRQNRRISNLYDLKNKPQALGVPYTAFVILTRVFISRDFDNY